MPKRILHGFQNPAAHPPAEVPADAVRDRTTSPSAVAARVATVVPSDGYDCEDLNMSERGSVGSTCAGLAIFG